MNRMRGIVGADTNGEAHAMCDPGIGSAGRQLQSLLPTGELRASHAPRHFRAGDLVIP
jgi:hypothetical protein